MSLRLLLFPLALASTVFVLVGYVKPDVSTIFLLRDDIRWATEEGRSVETTIANIHALSDIVDANKDKEALVNRYLPETLDQERTVNAITQVASQAGVAINSLSLMADVAPKEEPSIAQKPLIFNNESAAKGQNSLREAAALKPEYGKPRTYTADMQVYGAYASVKKFLEGLYRMDRMNSIVSFSLDRDRQGGGTQESQSTGVLAAHVMIRLPYYSGPVRVQNAYLLPVFTRPTLDFPAAEAIGQRTSGVSLADLESVSGGRTNPFER